MDFVEGSVIFGAVLFLVAQIFNRVSLSWRAAGTMAGVAVSAVTLLVAPRAWEAAIFGWFLGVAALIGKWGHEVELDTEERDEENLRPLIRDVLGIKVSLNPVFVVRYRHRIFRDRWSLDRLMQVSFDVPRVFADAEKSDLRPSDT